MTFTPLNAHPHPPPPHSISPLCKYTPPSSQTKGTPLLENNQGLGCQVADWMPIKGANNNIS
jgi:hypothetical protein